MWLGKKKKPEIFWAADVSCWTSFGSCYTWAELSTEERLDDGRRVRQRAAPSGSAFAATQSWDNPLSSIACLIQPMCWNNWQSKTVSFQIHKAANVGYYRSKWKNEQYHSALYAYGQCVQTSPIPFKLKNCAHSLLEKSLNRLCSSKHFLN